MSLIKQPADCKRRQPVVSVSSALAMVVVAGFARDHPPTASELAA